MPFCSFQFLENHISVIKCPLQCHKHITPWSYAMRIFLLQLRIVLDSKPCSLVGSPLYFSLVFCSPIHPMSASSPPYTRMTLFLQRWKIRKEEGKKCFAWVSQRLSQDYPEWLLSSVKFIFRWQFCGFLRYTH